MARNNKSRERRCRKNIDTFLSLIGFHDDHPQTTIEVMRKRLDEIKEEESQKKLSAIRKVVFKCRGDSRTRVIVQQRPRVPPLIQPPHNSEPLVTDAGNVNIEYVGLKLIKDLIRRMSGSETKLVIKKKLSKTDITSNQGRLLIPILQVKNLDFLTTNEKNTLEEEDSISIGEKKPSISVWVYDPKGRKYTLNLAQWNMKNTNNYVLKTNWNNVVKTNALKEGMMIQLFSFRIDQQLCFAIAEGFN